MSSLSPCTIIPETGHGAKKLKSYLSAGGDIAMKFSISGLLISKFKAMNAPNEKPTTHTLVLSVLFNNKL